MSAKTVKERQDALKARRAAEGLKEMIKVLQPFALMADEYDAEFGKNADTWLATSIGSIRPEVLRAARAAHNKLRDSAA